MIRIYLKKIIFIFLFLAFFIANGPSWAASLEEDLQTGTSAFQSGNFAKAAQLFENVGNKLKEMGNPQAPLLLGNAALAYMKAEDYAASAQLYQKLLQEGKDLPQQQLLQFYSNLVVCRGKLGEPDLQLETIENMFKAIPALSTDDKAAMLFHLGDAYRKLELYNTAESSYAQALKILPSGGDPSLRARLLTALGLSQGNLGHYAEARKNLEEAKAIAEKAGVPREIAEANSNLGVLAWEQGDYDEARKLLETALAVARENKLTQNEGSDNNHLAMVFLSKGNYTKALSHLEKALKLAETTGNVRSQGIAVENRALLHRIMGNHKDALADYSHASKLFAQAGFQEGQASALLGTGRMAELNDKNYVLALDNYEKALKIFKKLDLPRWQAAALLLLADAWKRAAAPGRSTRDLTFDESPTLPDINKNEANKKSYDYYKEALELAEKLHSPEILWRAHQGLGSADRFQGRLETALNHYAKAIDIAAGLYASPEDVKILGEYMTEREDLYREAMEICNLLSEKTGDPKYLEQLTNYAETLRNEMLKASAALVEMQFQDEAKQKLYQKIQDLGKAKVKARKAITSASIPVNTADKKVQAQIIKETEEQKDKTDKLQKDYDNLLAQWKKDYKEDAAIFDSSAQRMNIKEIQKALAPNQAMIYYNTLPDSILVTLITKDGTSSFKPDVPVSKLNNLIIDDFVAGYIHQGFKLGGVEKEGANKKYFDKSTATLSELYKLLLKPLEDKLNGIDRLYIVTDGFLSQIPFNILVCGEENGIPKYLIEKYELANLRPAFMDNFSLEKSRGKIKKMLAIANPRNENFPMSLLSGSIDEIGTANKNIKHDEQDDRDIALERYVGGNPFEPKDVSAHVKEQFPEKPDILEVRPTEQWLRDKLANNNYELLYFATHGQAQSDTYTKLADFKKRNLHNSKSPKTRRSVNSFITMRDKNLSENTPLNGFLLLSSEADDHVLDKDLNPSNNDIPQERDGLLTIREIMNLDKKDFANTKYVFLSACNTAVSLVPFAIGESYQEKEFFDPKLVEKDLRNMGLVPGIDQATFVESFMRKGVENIYASFWQLDDEAAKSIMNEFWKILADQGEAPDLVKAYAQSQRAHLATYKDKMAKTGAFAEDLHPYYWGAGAIFGK